MHETRRSSDCCDPSSVRVLLVLVAPVGTSHMRRSEAAPKSTCAEATPWGGHDTVYNERLSGRGCEALFRPPPMTLLW